MTAVQTTSLVLLALVLVVAIWRRINIGLLALAAAFVLVLLAGVDPKAMYARFPGDIFVLIAGVSLLFAHLERSGAVGWLVDRVYGAIGNRSYLLPWASFLIAASLSSVGAFSTAVIALLVPMIAHVGVKFRSTFLLTELAVVIGANSAGLSPLNPTGALVHSLASKANATYPVWGLWAVSIVVAALAVAGLQVFTAIMAKRGKSFVATPASATADEQTMPAPRWGYAITSSIALLAFVVSVVVFKTDVGLTSITLAVVLFLFFRVPDAPLIRRVPWNAILLLTGLLTYLGLMEIVGTMKAIEHGLGSIESAALLALVLAYLTVLLCNIESSTLGVLGLTIPLALATFGTSPVLFWVIAAMAVPAALMVMNPIHVAGTLIIGHAAEDEQPRLFRRLLAIAITLAVIVPGIIAIIPMSLLAGK